MILPKIVFDLLRIDVLKKLMKTNYLTYASKKKKLN